MSSGMTEAQVNDLGPAEVAPTGFEPALPP